MSAESDVFATGWRTNAVASGNVQTVQRNGREYLQFPLVPLTEMVYDYPENGTKEYLPATALSETAGLWDGTLLTYVHPSNRNQTVRDPDAFMGEVIGAFHDPKVLDGGEKLKGNGLIDVQKAKALGGSAAELVELLRNGEEVSVSAGYATTDDEHRSGRFDSEQYDLVQKGIIPDHIAVFPSDSRVQARCSPEDGCAAPRANAVNDQYQDGQSEQRATNAARANMSETVDTTEEQRQMTDELSSMLDEVESSGVPTDAQSAELRRLRTVTNGLGQVLENDSTSADVGPALKAVVEESKALLADVLDEKPHSAGDEKTNAACNCAGVCGCDRPFTSGSDGTGESLPNMQTVPGRMNRDLDADRDGQQEDSEEYPAGGRSNWEKRKLGLEDEEQDMPAGVGRSAWKQRKARQRRTNNHSGGDGDELGFPTGSRSSFEQRRNAQVDVDEQEWRDHEYPLMAKRKAEEREAKRQRWEKLREQAKRNDPNTARRRHNSS